MDEGLKTNLKLALWVVVLVVLVVGAVYWSFSEMFPSGSRDSQVVAIVNDDRVTRSELDARVNQVTPLYVTEGLDMRDESVRKEVETNVLEMIINDRLILQDALVQGIKVTPAEVEISLEGVIRQFDSREAFLREMEINNLSKDDFRFYTTHQLIIQKYLSENARVDDIEVSDEEVEFFYQEHADQLEDIPELGDELRVRIAEDIRQEKVSQAISTVINDLRSRADIEIFI